MTGNEKLYFIVDVYEFLNLSYYVKSALKYYSGDKKRVVTKCTNIDKSYLYNALIMCEFNERQK